MEGQNMQELFSTVQQMKDFLAKAETNATYSFSPAARNIFAPENLDPVVKTFVPIEVPMRSKMPRTRGFGQAAAWNALTSQLAPGDRGTGALPGISALGTGNPGFFADAGQPAQTTQVFTSKTAAYKNLGRDVEVGRQAIQSSMIPGNPSVEDMMKQRRRHKVYEVMLGEEWAIFNGDSAVNSLEFDGLAKTIVTHSGNMLLLTVSGLGQQMLTPATQNGASFEYLFCNPYQAFVLANELQAAGSIQRVIVDDQGRVTLGGKAAYIVNPITGALTEIVPHRYVGPNAYLLTFKAMIPGGESENALEMQDLDPLSYYDVPTANHSVQGRVFESTVLINRYEVLQKIITGTKVS
jgi:hypothetical protein